MKGGHRDIKPSSRQGCGRARQHVHVRTLTRRPAVCCGVHVACRSPALLLRAAFEPACATRTRNLLRRNLVTVSSQAGLLTGLSVGSEKPTSPNACRCRCWCTWTVCWWARRRPGSRPRTCSSIACARGRPARATPPPAAPWASAWTCRPCSTADMRCVGTTIAERAMLLSGLQPCVASSPCPHHHKPMPQSQGRLTESVSGR